MQYNTIICLIARIAEWDENEVALCVAVFDETIDMTINGDSTETA